MVSTARTTAAGEESIAKQTEAAGKTAETGDFLGAMIKSVSAVASIGLAPITGGASLAVGPAAAAALTGTSGLY